MTSKKPLSRVVSIVTSIVLIAVIGLVVYYQQSIVDYAVYLAYKPTPEIERMVERIGFTGDGKFRLYSSEPSIEGSSSFNKDCEAVQSEVNVLGCYTNNRIYVYNVQSEELDGIKEVTLAHETLHAVYERLSDGERQKVDATIDTYYAAHKTPELEKYMSNYPAEDKYTELHSVLGTEVGDLPAELEEHYAKYFNRDKVLKLYDGYHQKFVEVKDRADQLVKEAEALAKDVEDQTTSYNSATSALSARISSFNARASGGDFSSQAQFDAERAGLVTESDRLEALRVEINQKIERYTAIQGELQELELRNKELNNSINSKLDSAPKV
ncbi:MAG: hypothetical protein LBG75_02980 [Candidatus Nomurabacteria bacterium]|jgi:hypothetical protein|nr:hypothetical protein [Candidatus Nomurabacteria bacterium]